MSGTNGSTELVAGRQIAIALGAPQGYQRGNNTSRYLKAFGLEPAKTRPLMYWLDEARVVVAKNGGNLAALSAPVKIEVLEATATPSAGEITLSIADGTPRVSSRDLAQHLGSQHESLLRILTEYQADFEGFGAIRFEIGTTTPNNPKPPKTAHLNEDQAYLLLTYSQNTAQARGCKVALVAAFKQLRGQQQQPPTPQPTSTIDALVAKYGQVLLGVDGALTSLAQTQGVLASEQAAQAHELERLRADKAALEQRLAAQAGSVGALERDYKRLNDNLKSNPAAANWVRSSIVALGRELTNRGKRPPSHGKWYAHLYRQLNDAFNVPSYESLPFSRFPDIQAHIQRAYRTYSVDWPEDIFAASV
jgi:phage regulator Rha-like protein